MKNKRHLILTGLAVLLGAATVLWWYRSKPYDQSPMAVGDQDNNPKVAQQLTTDTGSNAAVSSGKQFIKMGVLERMAIMDEIKKQDLPLIFQAMLDAERLEHDDLKQMQLRTVLSNIFQLKKPTPEFMDQLYGFMTNRANSDFERNLLISALKSASTKETVDLLLRVANTAPDPEVRESAATLTGVGTRGQDGPELSPALERTWRETSNPTLIRSTANAMARIGAPSGIDLLLSAALATDDRDLERKTEARLAFREINKNMAVPPLAARLVDQPATSEAVKLLVPILTGISGEAGHKALVAWLQTRPENCAALVHDLFRRQILGDLDSFEKSWATALDPSAPFRNEENRKAVQEALEAFRALNKTTLEPRSR